MKLSKKGLITATVFSGLLAVYKFLSLLSLNRLAYRPVSTNAAAIGIIGGSDGPTSIFISGSNEILNIIFRIPFMISNQISRIPNMFIVVLSMAELVLFVYIFLYCLKLLMPKGGDS